jgi:hypothetical protein
LAEPVLIESSQVEKADGGPDDKDPEKGSPAWINRSSEIRETALTLETSRTSIERQHGSNSSGSLECRVMS